MTTLSATTAWPMFSLTQARQFAAQHVEDIASENKDEYNPVYSNFYETMEPRLITRLLQVVGFGKEEAHGIDIALFKKSLNSLIQLRELEGFFGNYVKKLSVKPGDKLIVWGPLQGSVHSLIRGLTELEQMGILADDLSLRADNCHLIFNGNLIGRSPYNLEILELMVGLMLKNPERVTYVRGTYESENYGENFNIEFLRALFENNLENRYSLASLLKRFINTLPMALYINYENGAEVLRISGVGREYKDIDERMMDDFLANPAAVRTTGLSAPVRHPEIYRLDNKKPSQGMVHVRVLIKGMDSYTEYVPVDGLKLLEPYGGATVWGVFSAPNRLSGIVSEFYTDAFSVITLGTTLHDTIIAVYNRDKRTLEPFAEHKRFLMYGGDELAPGVTPDQVTKDTILLGSSLDLTKRVAATGKAVRQGIMAAINECNSNRGPGGKRVKVIMLDDGYEPARTLDNFEYLMKYEKINTFLLPVGSPTLEMSMDFLKASSVAVLFPVSGSSELRSEALKSVINVRASYHDEVQVLLPFLMEKYQPKRFVIFYQDDIYGNGPLKDAREILKQYGITELVEIPYSRHTTDFKDVVDKIVAAKPDALGLFSASEPTKEMIRQLGIGPLVGVRVFGLSFLADETFKKFSEDFGYKYVFSCVVPNPKNSTLPLVQEYRLAMDKAGFKYSPASLEAFIGTNLTCEALRQLKGTFTPTSLLNFFESFKNYSFKGLTLNFEPETRALAHNVWIDTGDENWQQMLAPQAVVVAPTTQAQEPIKSLVVLEGVL